MFSLADVDHPKQEISGNDLTHSVVIVNASATALSNRLGLQFERWAVLKSVLNPPATVRARGQQTSPW